MADVTSFAELQTQLITLEGRANFKELKYNNLPLFLKLPRSTVANVELFTDPSKGNKLYLTVDITMHAQIFDTLDAWLVKTRDELAPDCGTHPLTRQLDNGRVQLKLKMPLTTEGTYNGGLFDDTQQPTTLDKLGAGCRVEAIIHAASLWNFRNQIGITLNAVQLLIHERPPPECLIADESTPYVPYNRGGRLMIT